MRTLLHGHPAHCPPVLLTPPSCQLVYVGWNFTVPEQLRDYSVKGAFRAPTRLHIGECTRMRCAARTTHTTTNRVPAGSKPPGVAA